MCGVDDLAERVTVLGDVDHERVDVGELVADGEREQRQTAALSQARRPGRGRRAPRRPAPAPLRRRRRRRPRRARRCRRLLRSPGSAAVRPSRSVMLLGSAVGAVDAVADAVGCGGGRGRQARLPARRRVDGEDDARSHARARPTGRVWNPEYGRPYTELGRDPERTVDERRVHAHRQNPVLVRGLPRRLGARGSSSATRTPSRRRCSTRSTSASRRTRSTTSSSGATTSTSSAGSTFRGGTTGSGSSRSSGAGCTSATSSGRGPAARRGSCSRGRSSAAADEQAAVDGARRVTATAGRRP